MKKRKKQYRQAPKKESGNTFFFLSVVALVLSVVVYGIATYEFSQSQQNYERAIRYCYSESPRPGQMYAEELQQARLRELTLSIEVVKGDQK